MISEKVCHSQKQLMEKARESVEDAILIEVLLEDTD